MRKLLGEHPGISYVKWDCNRKISDPGSPWLDACRQGNLPIDYVRGYEHVLDTLASEFPDVTFQACSSGGEAAPTMEPCGGIMNSGRPTTRTLMNACSCSGA